MAETNAMDNSGGTSGQVLTSNGAGAAPTFQNASGANTLDEAYDQGGSGSGRSITADGGAVEITVSDTSNNAGLIINQDDTTNNPVCFSVINAGTGQEFSLRSDAAGANGATFELFHNSASPAANDVIVDVIFSGNDAGASKQTYATMGVQLDDTTASSEDAHIQFSTILAGTRTNRLVIGEDINGIAVGSSTAAGVIESGGDQDLVLQTGNSTTGSITITDGANGAIDIAPNGSGNVSLGNLTFDADQTIGAGQDNYVLTYDNAGGLISLEAASGGSSETLDDVGNNSTSTANSLYTMTSNIDVEFETSSNATLLYMDESAGRVGVGTDSPQRPFHVNGADGFYVSDTYPSPTKGFRARFGGATDFEFAGNDAYFSVWANGDFTGSQDYKMLFEDGNDITQAIGDWQFRISANGNIIYRLDSSSGGDAVFNEQGDNDRDFRVETDTDTHALFVDASANNVGVGVSTPDTKLDVDGAITLRELSADPSDPDEGSFAIWMSDGTGSGDDGDIMVKITAGATTKTVTLVDFSAS